MAKRINVQIAVDDEEYEKMLRLKGDRTWEDVVRDGLEKVK